MKSIKKNGLALLVTQYRNAFCIGGYLTESMIAGFGEALKEVLVLETKDSRIIKSAFSIFVEQFQNIIRYSADRRGGGGTPEAGYGVLTVGKVDEKLFLGCGNLIKSVDVGRLKKTLTAIQRMDRNQLKSLYKQTLRSGAPKGSKGAGVGFIEIAMRATHGFEVEFIKMDVINSVFTMNACIKIK